MKDRIPANPGRVLITPENGGTPFYATVTRADNPTQDGDPINKNTLLKDPTAALYGLGSDAVPDDVFQKINATLVEPGNFTVEKITFSTNWIAPKAKNQWFKVFAVGGGGAGGRGGSSSFGGGGGGGGGYVEIRELTIPEGTIVPVVCGAGGLTVSDPAPGNGGDGGTTSFGSYFSAAGGKGGGGASNNENGGKGGDGGAGGGGGACYSDSYKAGDGGNGGTYGGGGGGASITSASNKPNHYGKGGNGGTYGGDGASGPGYGGVSTMPENGTPGAFSLSDSCGFDMTRDGKSLSPNNMSYGGGGGYGGNGGLTSGNGGGGGGGYGGNGGNGSDRSQRYACGGGGGGLFCNGGYGGGEGTYEYGGGGGGIIDGVDGNRSGTNWASGGSGGCYIVYYKEV